MFDPENVGRWKEQLEMIPNAGEEVVAASDYDQLLELYRKIVPDAEIDPGDAYWAEIEAMERTATED